MHIMHSASGRDGFGCIGRASAEVVFAVGAGAKVGGVAIDANLGASLESMVGSGEAYVLTDLKEIAISLHHGPGSGIERLKQSVAELHCGVSVVKRGKTGSGARDAD